MEMREQKNVNNGNVISKERNLAYPSTYSIRSTGYLITIKSKRKEKDWCLI